MYPYLIQGNNIVIVIDNNSHTINKQHISYQKIVDAIKASDWESIKELIEPTKSLVDYGQNNIKIEGGVLYWRGEVFSNALSDKIIEMYREGFPIEPMIAFMENLMTNPSHRSVTELYRFLERGNLPITSDGCFLAYKKVRSDYKDCHTGTIDNSVGQIVEMERNKVDDDKDRTCSSGLHFCSQDYLNHFGGERIMILKINPRDVVSVPSDYNDTKGRCCRYEVIGELTGSQKPGTVFTKPVQDNIDEEEDVDEDLSYDEYWDQPEYGD
jgi:hypothetical protein